MRTIVVDASALVDYLLRSDGAPDIGVLVLDPDNDLHIPALCDIEVAAAFRRALLNRSLSEGREQEAIQDYLDLPVTRHGHETLLARIIELRHNFTAYDATYVALALEVDGELLTADHALAGAARKHVRVV